LKRSRKRYEFFIDVRPKGETLMRLYETLYLINPELADEDYRGVVDKFNSLIEKNKGVLIKVDEWGKKSLAYDVKKFDKGYYVLLNFCGEPDLISELRRDFKLDDRVLKYQTIKLSDKADPEVLRERTEEGAVQSGDEAQHEEDAAPDRNDVIVKKHEERNGIQ
jgi:small subunit ribosomal protein S6